MSEIDPPDKADSGEDQRKEERYEEPPSDEEKDEYSDVQSNEEETEDLSWRHFDVKMSEKEINPPDKADSRDDQRKEERYEEPPSDEEKDQYSDVQSNEEETEDSSESETQTKNPLVVVAIDFGTTYSGWAFSTRSDYRENPDKVHHQIWQNGGNLMLKTNTCILFNEEGYRNGQFDSFGYDAMEKYIQKCEDNEKDSYYFFQEYKMVLYENMEISSNSTLTAHNGKKMNALTIFSESIRFLVDNFKTRNASLYRYVRKDEIRWVLTVPAIWNEKAKSFMREAAVKAGLESDQLLIALEPEAAALYCKNLPVLNNEKIFSIFQHNSKYMVVDIGGGTFDITVSIVTQDGLEELKRANGGSYGGTSVNKEFWDLLRKVFGSDKIAKFKVEYPDDYLALQQNFEVKKKTLTFNDKRGDINIVIPPSLYQCVMDKGADEEWIPNEFDGKLKVVKRGKMKFNGKILENLFKKSIFKITRKISDMLSDPKLFDLRAILFVGGFSNSPVLFERIKAIIEMENPEVLILRPPEAISAVVKGAVHFGHEPDIFRKRVCRYTYGIQTNMPFDASLDSQSMLEVDDDGNKYCRNRFSKHATCGDAYATGTYTEGEIYFPFTRDQKSIEISVYVSRERNPRYTSYNCDYIGSLTIDLSDLPREEQQVEVAIMFGETELATVKAREIKTGKEVHAELSFIG